MDEVIFKSKNPYFTKEKTGIKNNTVRELDTDERFDILMKGIETKKFPKIRIRLMHEFNKQVIDDFVRQISDVTYWKGLLIITWEHRITKQPPNE